MTDISNRSAEIDQLATALAKAQGVIEGAKKDAENPGFKRDGKNSTYADLASVWDAIRTPLAANGLAIMQWPRTVENGVEIDTILTHASGQWMSSTLWMPVGQTMTVHTVGSAITYGRRYALMAVVGVAPVDDDGNAAAEGAHKPGMPGSASGGGDFRPAQPRRFSGGNMVDESRRDGTLDETRPKGTLPVKGAAKPTPAEAKAAKVKAAVDKRIQALKDNSAWTRASLDDFWAGDKVWIDWMADPANEVLKEYERFTDAFADAELNMREVA